MKTIALIVTMVCATLAGTIKTNAQVSVQITVAPPAIPVYTQPVCPADGYLWSPGYWAWDPVVADYYWVPGVWVQAARPGWLWTPGYWGFEGGYYGWHAGYWGATVGFYGGVNYGWGYGGSGFYGCRWVGGHYQYNTAVVNVNTTVIHNTYVDNTVVNHNGGGASFNGRGGLTAQPTAAERTAMSQPHIAATSEQQSHQTAAKQDKSQYAKANGGKPTTTAMNKVGGQHFSSQGHPAAPAAAKTAQPVQHTAAPAQHTNPAPQQHTAAPVQHTTPAPQQHTAQPAQHTNPAPQQQHTAAPAQHANPAPQQHMAAPAPHNNPAPQQHRAPAPHPAPAPHEERK